MTDRKDLPVVVICHHAAWDCTTSTSPTTPAITSAPLRPSRRSP